tara:strand:- start:4425 stop:4877 length:453 start_codon:yes stop_codon:yes gene_type:complete
MKPKHKRLYLYSTLLIIFFVGCVLLFVNLRDNLVYFYSPTDISEGKNEDLKKIRIGGMVVNGSIERNIIIKDGKKLENINFKITDYANSVDINYVGILPDLFKEDQGVIVEGKFDEKRFFASKVLAKHDENYMPPEIEDLVNSKVNQNDN